jgi:DNA recombination protein RmuC
MNKMVNSPKRGDTLVGRAEKIRELGARATKSLPADMVEEALENQTETPALIP